MTMGSQSQQTKDGRPLIISHGHCSDGATAAWIAHRYFKGECDIIFAAYGDPVPDATGRPVFVIDFSWPRAAMIGLTKMAKRLTVLDHHQSAAADLHEFADEPELDDAWVYVDFDMSRSGAMIAWHHFFPDEEVPWLVRYVDDRDRWVFALPHSHAVNAALASYPRTFEQFDYWLTVDVGGERWRRLVDEGEAILRYQKQLVDGQCEHAGEVEIAGHRVPCVNATVLISEICGQLAADKPFAATWFERADGSRVYSLRSRGEGGLDVSEIAKRMGGGGHVRSSGYTVRPKQEIHS